MFLETAIAHRSRNLILKFQRANRNFRIFRALVVDKMVRKGEGRLVVTLSVSLLASFSNSLVGASSSECQTVARDGVHPEVVANSSQNTSLNSTSSPRILRRIAAISGPRLTLATSSNLNGEIVANLLFTFMLHFSTIIAQNILEFAISRQKIL